MKNDEVEIYRKAEPSHKEKQLANYKGKGGTEDYPLQTIHSV